MKSIGFIGVGSMGAPMAVRLIEAGYGLTVCDKNRQAMDRFKEMGIRATDKPADCADKEIIIVMVVDDAQVKEMVQGPGGVPDAASSARAPLLVVMSTVLPQTIHELAPRCAEKGVRLVEAPVGGMLVAAARGKLSILVGGSAADLDEIRPIFGILGEHIFHTGPLGSGSITKLVNNMISITNVLLTAEAMLVGKRCGMDPFHLASILAKSTGLNWLTKDWDQGRATFEFYSQDLNRCREIFDILRKDLMHAQKLAQNGDVPCPLLDQIVKGLEHSSCSEVKEQWHSVL